MVKIKVPATTANLGPGFDSFGLALTVYLELDVLGESDEWKIEHTFSDLPKDKSNLIIQSALHVLPNLPPHQLVMKTDIPTARGLGSSSSAIVAGIELANQLGHLKLTPSEKVSYATEIEGHPDNVAPAILGGFIVAASVLDKSYYTQHSFPECDIVVMIPSYKLLTHDSREVLPKTITHKEGVDASSISNVVLGAILSDNLSLAGELMEQDLWHEKYRESLVPELTAIKKLKDKLGFYAAVLSGAGPTVLILSPREKTEHVKLECGRLFGHHCTIQQVNVDHAGVVVTL